MDGNGGGMANMKCSSDVWGWNDLRNGHHVTTATGTTHGAMYHGKRRAADVRVSLGVIEQAVRLPPAIPVFFYFGGIIGRRHGSGCMS